MNKDNLPVFLDDEAIVKRTVEKRPNDPYPGKWGVYGYDSEGRQIWASVGFRTKRDAQARLAKGRG